MEFTQFNTQADRFVKVANEFPDVQVTWESSMLKMYLTKGVEWEICILFSHAYNCPVLYFRSRTEYLTLEEINKHLHLHKEFVSTAELPLTGEPFYFLHPCNSKNILPSPSLSAWLSVVLQTFGTNLPIQLYAELEKNT